VVQVVWTKKAQKCLGEIHKYIDAHNPAAANRVIRGILLKAELLRNFPLVGAAHPLDAIPELRVLRHGHYRIAYVIRRSESHVLGVFHERMDLGRHLKRP
jgi:plasmid stabilization system protein ParE